MDKALAAEKIRECAEKRLANFLGCDVVALPKLKLGELIHLSFLLWGLDETIGGFHSTMAAALKLVGRDAMWEEPKTEEMEEPKVVVN